MNGKLGKVIRRLVQQGKSIDDIYDIAYVYCAIFNAKLIKTSTINKIATYYRSQKNFSEEA